MAETSFPGDPTALERTAQHSEPPLSVIHARAMYEPVPPVEYDDDGYPYSDSHFEMEGDFHSQPLHAVLDALRAVFEGRSDMYFASDMGLIGMVTFPHALPPAGFQLASLDHAMWFHCPVRVDEWMLFDLHSPRAGGARVARALELCRLSDRADQHVLANRERIEAGIELEGPRHAPVADEVGAHPRDFPPLQLDVAAGGGVDTGDDVEKRGLAGAVGATDADHVSRVNVEIEIVYRRQRAEILEDIPARQQRRTFPRIHRLNRVLPVRGDWS
jgi:hypothetical protein